MIEKVLFILEIVIAMKIGEMHFLKKLLARTQGCSFSNLHYNASYGIMLEKFWKESLA